MPATITTDAEIIDLLQRHSEQALIDLVEKYGRYCYSIAYRVLRSPWDTEECMNDVLWKCWQSVAREPPKCLKSYLSSLTYNQAISVYRKNHAEKRVEAECMLAEASVAWEDPCTSIAVSDCLDAMLSERTETDRRLFAGRYKNGQPIRALAQAEGLTESCVKSKLARMRQSLKCELEKNDILPDESGKPANKKSSPKMDLTKNICRAAKEGEGQHKQATASAPVWRGSTVIPTSQGQAAAPCLRHP